MPAPASEDPPSRERSILRGLLYFVMAIALLTGIGNSLAPGSTVDPGPAFIVFAVSLAGLACSAGD